MTEQSSYYAIIPANVRYSDKLKPMEKLMYGEITCLANKKGYCYASNKYFAELYNVSKNTVSIWINNLVKQSFIDTRLIKKGKEIIERRLYLKNTIPITENDDRGIIKNSEDNTTSINNTRKESVERIFEYWKLIMNTSKSVFDDKRDRDIRKGLKLFNENELMQAIDGCSKTPHNMGDNDQNTKYNGLHVIFKNADQIERFINNNKNPPRKPENEVDRVKRNLLNNINNSHAVIEGDFE